MWIATCYLMKGVCMRWSIVHVVPPALVDVNKNMLMSKKKSGRYCFLALVLSFLLAFPFARVPVISHTFSLLFALSRQTAMFTSSLRIPDV